MKRSRVVALALGLGYGSLFLVDGVCFDAWRRYGIRIPDCPDGRVRQTAELSATSLRRGAPGFVTFRATAHYTLDGADAVQTAPVEGILSIELSLVGANKQRTKLPATWEVVGSDRRAEITLPALPDGDYQLHASFVTRVGAGELEVPLPLYTSARVHVLTDRPLYEPGNTVQFRAVVLKAKDSTPVDGRPGHWVVSGPDGEVLLEEQAPAGEWGVVAGSFPLDKGAPHGRWTVRWASANASDEVAFDVRPFTLPRFAVEASADKAFYRVGDTPAIKGAVTYSSGAPVAQAPLEITWHVDGWPPPRAWLDTLLPKTAKTAANGRFTLALPAVPDDLVGTATLHARIAAIDPAGDRVEGAATVLLSKDGISVASVTQLGDGLVEGFNNRMYVRVATPDGAIVPNAKITVKRAWQANDNGLVAHTDVDGVASLQLDPGPPVHVVIPPMPWRPAPRAPLVARGEVTDLIAADGGALADQLELDRWLGALAPCAKWWDAEAASAKIGLRVDAAGTIVTLGGGTTPLDRCVIERVRGKRLPAGRDRMYSVTFAFTDPALSTLTPTIDAALEEPEGLAEELDTLAKSTRDCLPAVDGSEGALPMMLTWKVEAGTKHVELGTWVADPHGGDARGAMTCVTSRISAGTRITLTEKAAADSLGVVRFSMARPASETAPRPQATTMLGYELLVSADIPGAPATKLVVPPGAVPPLRLRVEPVIAKPGDTITAELLRGPNFDGVLPKKLLVTHLRGKSEPVLDKARKATFRIDANAEGWVEVKGAGQRALVYITPSSDLEVAVTAKQPRYAPGDNAELAISTKLGGRGGRAAVGLFGVDQSLGRLVTLLGADDMARVRPRVETATPAFGTLDGQALALGRIRGANAAAATVARVTAIPAPPQLDAQVSARGASGFDAVGELTDNFYAVLAELHVVTRAWEAKAK
ncbi:MAG TPA: MG2 domain-containing protein, partial [Kofleriaceae bacterium]|nr:MG2 domain-containing protein [Kofleriaceae bacterium]